MKLFKKIYILFFAALLLVPLSRLNTAQDAISAIDNRKLTDAPTSFWEWFDRGENYIKDRIGFRNAMINLYRKSIYTVFGELQHPLYMLGKEGHLFYGYEQPLNVYHGLDYEDGEADRIMDKLHSLQARLHAQNIDFLFVPLPSKQVLLDEYYPDNVAKNKRPTLLKLLLERLAQSDIPYMDMEKTLLEFHAQHPVHQVKFDPGHMNAVGMFKTHESIAQHLQNLYKDYPPLQWDDFTHSMEAQDLTPYFIAGESEDVPMLLPKTQSYQLSKSREGLAYDDISYNPNAPVKKTLLLAGDSYFVDARIYGEGRSAIDYYAPAFTHVYLSYNADMDTLDELVAKYHPDIIIYEAVDMLFWSHQTFHWE